MKVSGMSIADFTAMPVERALETAQSIKLAGREALIAGRVMHEVVERLQFLNAVGLGYISLDRSAATLSGGEGQRIRLATQIGSKLRGVLYVLDEPSIGLHHRDNGRLLNALENLRDLGNTVLVVEHDEETIRRADYVVDLGPGAGRHGGSLVAHGTPEEIMREPNSLTGAYISGRTQIEMRAERRQKNGAALTILSAKENNLKNLDVTFPLGVMTVVTGVSGSGKSTLVNDILYRALARQLYRSREKAGEHKAISGAENIDKVIRIDQSPIGRTPRSNPATYTGVFTAIRDLYAMLPESRERGYKAGRFSFNVSGGRCEACQGEGQRRIEMNFLPDVYVLCEVCGGRRYNSETLAVKYNGYSIADLLEMPVSDALPILENIPQVKPKLQTLGRCGSRIHSSGAVSGDAFGRRGAAHQVGARIEQAADRQDSVPAGRTDDRSALRRRKEASGRAASSNRPGELDHHHRTQSGCDSERRLDHRPRAGGRRGWWPHCGAGYSGAGRAGEEVVHWAGVGGILRETSSQFSGVSSQLKGNLAWRLLKIRNLNCSHSWAESRRRRFLAILTRFFRRPKRQQIPPW